MDWTGKHSECQSGVDVSMSYDPYIKLSLLRPAIFVVVESYSRDSSVDPTTGMLP